MKNKKVSMVLATAMITTMLIGELSVGTSFAKPLPLSSVKSVEVTDKEGNPLTGIVDNESLNKKGMRVKIQVDFPDDAEPGDTVAFDITIPLKFPGNELTLSNENGDKIADLTITVDKDEGTTKFLYTLLESAKDLVNRSVNLTITASGDPIECNPVKARKGKDVSCYQRWQSHQLGQRVFIQTG